MNQEDNTTEEPEIDIHAAMKRMSEATPEEWKQVWEEAEAAENRRNAWIGETQEQNRQRVSRLKALWDREYSEAGVIPGSSREAPSQALLLFSELLGFRSMKRALDVGCGNGRNSLYLAELGLQVEAIDFSPAAIAETRTRAAQAGLLGSIRAQEHNVEQDLPFEPESFDLCLDFHVYCHIAIRDQLDYIKELWRITRVGGYAIVAMFSPQDEYYARLIETSREPIPALQQVGDSVAVRDPANGIVTVLYPKEDFKREFTIGIVPFEVRYFVEFEFDDMVQNKPYHREILAVVLQKLEDERDVREAEVLKQHAESKARAKALHRERAAWWSKRKKHSYAQIGNIMGISEEHARNLVNQPD